MVESSLHARAGKNNFYSLTPVGEDLSKVVKGLMD